MSVDRAEGRRANHRAFRPTLDGGLEPRCLLTNILPHSGLTHLSGALYVANPRLGIAYNHNNPPFTTEHAPHFDARFPLTKHVGEQTAHGGQTAKIYQDGGAWYASLTEYPPAISAGGVATQSTSGNGVLYAPPYQVPGTVRAYPMPGGKWGLIVNGSTTLTDLAINPAPFPQRKGYAHSFAYAYAGRPRIMNIGAIVVTSGQIGAIEGFHTADLSGPITINGTETVDRIAFNSIQPGGAITTGGTLNTLDVAGPINLTGNSSISIGQDLNLLNIGQNLNLSNGSNFTIGRTLGALPQPAKGTSTGANLLSLNQSLVGTQTNQQFPNLAAYIQGDVNIGPNSAFTIGRGIGANTVVYVGGDVSGASRITIPNGVVATSLNPLNGNILFNGNVTP